MWKIFVSLSAVLALAACTQKPKVGAPTKPGPQMQTASRDEPVFYNGRNYLVHYDFNPAKKAFDVTVKGKDKALGPGDAKAATEIATGAVRFFACPKGQIGQVSGKPSFNAGVWSMAARCA
jgi:hypothetical protein